MHGRGGYWQINPNHEIGFKQSRACGFFYSERGLHIKILLKPNKNFSARRESD